MREKGKSGYAARETEMDLFSPSLPADSQSRRRAPGRVGSNRISRILLWFCGTGLAAIVAGVFFKGFADSPFFALERIAVEGNFQTSPGKIPGLVALEAGGNLLTLDIGQVVRSLGSRPEIRRASVAKRFPNELVVKVEERKPSVLLLSESRLYLADEECIVLREVGPEDPLDLPVISGLGRARLAVGSKFEGRQLPAAIRLLRSVERSASTLGPVSEIRVDPSEGLTLFLESLPVPIRFGWGDFEGKIARLERILPKLLERQGGLVSVDLRFARQVVVRQRPADGKVAARKDGKAALAQLSSVVSAR